MTGNLAASGDLRDTDPTTHSNDDGVCWQDNSTTDATTEDRDHSTPINASPQVSQGMGGTPSLHHSSQPRCSAKFVAPKTQTFDPDTSKSLAAPRCGYCSRPVIVQVSGGRPRKWCSERCRKAAARNLP